MIFQVRKQNIKPRDEEAEGSDGEEGEGNEADDPDKMKEVNAYMARKAKDLETLKRIKQNQIDNKEAVLSYLQQAKESIKRDKANPPPKSNTSKRIKPRPIFEEEKKPKKKFLSTQEFLKRKNEARSFLKTMKKK